MFEYLEKIIDVNTGEEKVRNYTDEEIAMVEAAKQEAAEELAKIEAAIAKKTAALTKLEALGLNEDDLKALGL